MARLAAIVFICLAAAAAEPPWQLALPGWHYEFPRDHRNHPGFKTEWWYFTGNLQAKDGRAFGYQLTFFRQGVIPPAERLSGGSRFITADLKFAHFALSDLSRGKFLFNQLLSRGAFGEAGFDDGRRIAWIDACSLELRPGGAFHLVGRDAGKSFDLTLRSAKPPAIHGENGVSQKADGAGRASHYYSLTRLETSGTVTTGGETLSVSGLSWFDHEWASNQLAPHQVGWDWFSLQFADGTELMLFQLRTKNGDRDHWSGGSWIGAGGAVTRIANADFTLDPIATWKSASTGAAYPTGWRLRVPRLALDVEVAARMNDQELRLKPIAYWEGAVSASGTRDGKPATAAGYLEMTGYAGAVVGLQAGE
ncbi:MAG: lipocalin-like domain-containing protein [Terrimicrobiaceae bacterium]|nr:lipocalin-like domain-containing protein [Terrimicrobiaceae bacterium]